MAGGARRAFQDGLAELGAGPERHAPQPTKTMAKKATPKARRPAGSAAKQVFTFNAPSALSVMLVGDFTHWQEQPLSLVKGEDGLWRTEVELLPGVYHYRFMVDGQWRDDPECTLRVSNPFGGENMVRQVG